MLKPTESPVKILLADDSVTMHRAVALALKKLPWQLVTCDNGQDAFRLTLEQRPDVVIADLDMPGMTGAELCQAIRAKPALAKTKLILLCGSFDQVDEARLEKIPADGRLWKPFESHVLTALVDALLKASAATARESSDPTLNSAAPMSGNSDLARDMTTETFSQALPSAVVASPPPQSSRLVSVPPLAPAQVSSLKESHLPEDLWSAPSPALIPVPQAEPEPEPEFDTLNLASFENLHESRIIDPAVLEDADPLNLESMPEPALRDSFASVATVENVAATIAPAAPGLSEQALRALVREEIERAFGSWLKDRLEKTLSLVIAEIDRS